MLELLDEQGIVRIVQWAHDGGDRLRTAPLDGHDQDGPAVAPDHCDHCAQTSERAIGRDRGLVRGDRELHPIDGHRTWLLLAKHQRLRQGCVRFVERHRDRTCWDAKCDLDDRRYSPDAHDRQNEPHPMRLAFLDQNVRLDPKVAP
jgi:hypothetical protein